MSDDPIDADRLAKILLIVELGGWDTLHIERPYVAAVRDAILAKLGRVGYLELSDGCAIFKANREDG